MMQCNRDGGSYNMPRTLRILLSLLGKAAATPLVWIVFMLETLAVGLTAAISLSDNKIPLVSEMDYTAPINLVRSSITAFAFGLSLAGVRVIVINVLRSERSRLASASQQQESLTPELQALLAMKEEEDAPDIFGLQFVASLLWVSVALATTASIVLLAVALWNIFGS